ncbi:hypothetical protein D9M72_447340 [compost metagenome]
MVGGIEMQRGRELPFQRLGHLPHLRHVAATHHQRGGAEDLVAQRSVSEEGLGAGAEQSGLALQRVAGLSARYRPYLRMLRERVHAATVGVQDAGRQHALRADARQAGRSRFQEPLQAFAFHCQHQAGVGAELAGAERQRAGKGRADGLGAVGQRVGE